MRARVSALTRSLFAGSSARETVAGCTFASRATSFNVATVRRSFSILPILCKPLPPQREQLHRVHRIAPALRNSTVHAPVSLGVDEAIQWCDTRHYCNPL